MSRSLTFELRPVWGAILLGAILWPGTGAAIDTVPTPPVSWIDQTTGHRIFRLTDQPGSRGLYFNYTAFAPDGKTMVYTANHNIYVVDLTTRKSTLLVSGPVREIVVAHKNPIVYFLKPRDERLYVADIPTGELRVVATLPSRASINTINADDTLLAGTYIDGPGDDIDTLTLPPGIRPSTAAKMVQRLEEKLPSVLFTLETKTGKTTPILHTTDWLGHLLFSPTDPALLMYCHEGLWQDVDRIWTIRTDGSDNTLIHKRTQKMEIAGHEFWDPDGKTIWYDLQVPKGKRFYLASYDTTTHENHRYRMDRNQWSIHFNIAPNGELFSGDGGDPFQVAGAPDGQWIELYHTLSVDRSKDDGAAVGEMGVIQSEHLVSMASHRYSLEPNVRFSPDNKLVIFTSNIYGPSYIFGVEIRKAKDIPSNSPRVYEPPATQEQFHQPVSSLSVVDSTNRPLPNAHVIIKSLDSGHIVAAYDTDTNGKLPAVPIEQGLYRVTITWCSSGHCAFRTREMFTDELQGQPVVTAIADADTGTAQHALQESMSIVVQDQNKKPINHVQVLARSGDAAKEHWYETDGSGGVKVVLPTDPATVVLLYHRAPHFYKFASDCASDSTNTSGVIQCLPITGSVTLQISSPEPQGVNTPSEH